MKTYSADEIVGKTLIAKNAVFAYDLPTYEPNSKIIGTIKPNTPAGVVFSYVGGQPNRPLNWQFKGVGGKMYYINHMPGMFDVQALQQQGALTTQEKQEQAQEQNLSTGDKLLSYFKKTSNVIIFTALGLVALNVILKNRK